MLQLFIDLILPSFPIHAFPTGIEPYRPPQSIKDSQISKITCCDDTFAALSSNGEVFTFSAPSLDTNPGEGRAFKPQRVWALRKKFSAVRVSFSCLLALPSFLVSQLLPGRCSWFGWLHYHLHGVGACFRPHKEYEEPERENVQIRAGAVYSAGYAGLRQQYRGVWGVEDRL